MYILYSFLPLLDQEEHIPIQFSTQSNSIVIVFIPYITSLYIHYVYSLIYILGSIVLLGKKSPQKLYLPIFQNAKSKKITVNNRSIKPAQISTDLS